MKKLIILLAITLAFLTISCAMVPVPAQADDSATKVIKIRKLYQEIDMLSKAIQIKSIELQPKLTEFNKLKSDYDKKKKEFDKLMGIEMPEKEKKK